jgi:hypothetical protein
MPNKLSQFWRELKHRKIFFAFTEIVLGAFAITELISIAVEALYLHVNDV